MWNLLLMVLSTVLSVSVMAVPAGDQKTKKLKIELGRTFRNDLVKVYFDKKLVYSKQITTPDSSQFTDSFIVNKPKKPYVITVEVNGEKFEKSSPKGQRELDKEDYSLLINYDLETETVEIKTVVVIVLYD